MLPSDIRYVRPVRPVAFPSSDPEWDMGQTSVHLNLCVILRDILLRAVGEEPASVGCDQFVFFDPSDAQRKCAPDAFVKLGVSVTKFDVWKTWEGGVPELCVEVLSASDLTEKHTLTEKLARFHTMGVREIVAFHVEGEPGARLRAWDLIEGDLVERVVMNDATPCTTLGLWFVVAPAPDESAPAEVALRLSEDAGGKVLIATKVEAEALAARRADQRAAEALQQTAKAQEQTAKAQEQVALAHKQRDAAVEELERLRSELERRKE